MRRTAAMCETCGENVRHDPYDDELVHLDENGEFDYDTEYDHEPKAVYDDSDFWHCAGCGKGAVGSRCYHCGGTESIDDQIVRAMENHKERSMRDRMGAIEFVASQNTTDREELLFRAHRHASNLTGQLPVPVAQRVVQDFVAAVNREIVAGTSKYAPGGKLDRERKAQEKAARDAVIQKHFDDWAGRTHPSYRQNFDDALDFFHDHTLHTDAYQELFGDEDMRNHVYDFFQKKFPTTNHRQASREGGIKDFPDELMY